MGAVLLLLILSLIAFAIYFMPSIVAVARKKHNTGAIVVLNVFLGWTIVGWVCALVWAFVHDQGPSATAGTNKIEIPSDPTWRPTRYRPPPS